MKSIVIAVFRPEAQLMLFLRMRTKNVKKSPKHSENVFWHKLFALQEVRITNANDDIRFLTRGQIYKESKVSPKLIFERRFPNL